MDGRVTNIQRFSLHDGPGIRTTVFLHGCNMSCAWCHNPETLVKQNELLFYPNKCIGCGHCFEVCPSGARPEGFRPDLCVGCGRCVDVCYPKAIQRPYAVLSVEEVMAEIRQDALYYQNSGGGVTFSGGEALCQASFVAALTEACALEGIGTALETNLLVAFDPVEPLLRRMALIMADIKLLDHVEHRKWTGISNALILENAIRLGELGVPLVFRTPLIPGATDSEENLTAIAQFVSRIPNVLYYELINFNPLGAAKYEALRVRNPFADARPFDRSRLDALRELLSDIDIPVKID